MSGHEDAPVTCEKCGWPDGSFACKIRCYVQINTGDAKAARD